MLQHISHARSLEGFFPFSPSGSNSFPLLRQDRRDEHTLAPQAGAVASEKERGGSFYLRRSGSGLLRLNFVPLPSLFLIAFFFLGPRCAHGVWVMIS